MSVKSHLTLEASLCPENALTYSVGNEGQKICGVFSDTASFQSYGTCCIVRPHCSRPFSLCGIPACASMPANVLACVRTAKSWPEMKMALFNQCRLKQKVTDTRLGVVEGENNNRLVTMHTSRIRQGVWCETTPFESFSRALLMTQSLKNAFCSRMETEVSKSIRCRAS